jgi:acetylornithine deacetylase/succinyl-diaminopimelate desuccinylase-like protein
MGALNTQLEHQIATRKNLEVDPVRSPSRRWGTVAEEVRVTRLEANGITVIRASDAAEAKRLVLDLIPAASSAESPLARDLARAITEVQGRTPKFEMCPGLLEIRFYAALGQPDYAYGQGGLEVAHGNQESVELTEIDEIALVYALTAARHLST